MKPSRFEYSEAFTVVGCPQFSNPRKMCPGLAWERLKKQMEGTAIAGAFDFEIGLEVYPSDFPGNGGEFYYMAGIPLREPPSAIPVGLFAFSVPANEYAVFEVDGIDSLPETVRKIYNEWLPASGYLSVNDYDFEKYRYVPDLKVEICIPVAKETVKV